MIPSRRVGATLGVQENRHRSCRSEHVRKPQARLVSSVVFPATSTTCESTTVYKRDGSRAAVHESIRARLEAPLGSPLPSPSVWQPSRACFNRSAAACCKGSGRRVRAGRDQASTQVSRKREPSPLTSRARTYAPACLTHSPRSTKGRLTEHRDPVARQSPGSEERDCRSAAAPARRVTCLARVGIRGVHAAKSVLLRSDARVRAALESGAHAWAPTVR